MSLPVAILAGGLATRLRPLTERIPKSLVAVAGKPFAEHQLELLARNGIRDVVFCVGYLGEQIQAALGEGGRWDVRIQYVFDGETLLGTGGALRRATPYLGDAFFVMYGDSYLDCDFQAIARAFESSGQDGLMTVFQNEDQWDRSNVLYRDSRILQYSKMDRSPHMRHIDYGLGILRARALEHYPEEGMLDLATVYQDLLARDRLAGYEVPSRFYEIGSPVGLEETNAYLRSRGYA
jgi:N-acetyl-alpha-D-muramate 1-phosphate uridylyltransferase